MRGKRKATTTIAVVVVLVIVDFSFILASYLIRIVRHTFTIYSIHIHFIYFIRHSSFFHFFISCCCCCGKFTAEIWKSVCTVISLYMCVQRIFTFQTHKSIKKVKVTFRIPNEMGWSFDLNHRYNAALLLYVRRIRRWCLEITEKMYTKVIFSAQAGDWRH